MKIETLKQLEQVIKLCRKTGVQSIAIDGVQLQLGDAPEKASTATSETKPDAGDAQYTDEDYLLWSAQPQVS